MSTLAEAAKKHRDEQEQRLLRLERFAAATNASLWEMLGEDLNPPGSGDSVVVNENWKRRKGLRGTVDSVGVTNEALVFRITCEGPDGPEVHLLRREEFDILARKEGTETVRHAKEDADDAAMHANDIARHAEEEPKLVMTPFEHRAIGAGGGDEGGGDEGEGAFVDEDGEER